MTAEELAEIRKRHERDKKSLVMYGPSSPATLEWNEHIEDRDNLLRYARAQAQRIAELEAQLAACEQRLDHTLIAYQEASSGALATAQAVTLTEEDLKTAVKQIAAENGGWPLSLDTLAEKLSARLTNGASTP